MEETWKNIKNYEGLYQVSNLGRIKSLAKEWTSAYNSRKRHNEIIMKQRKQNCNYILIKLCKDGACQHKLVHRLVAEAFIPNPNNLPQVNHKDGNKTNNCVNNLEWVNRSENIRHAFANNLINLEHQKEKMRKLGKMQKGKNNKNWKGYINIYNDKNELIIQCESFSEIVKWIKNNTKYKNPSAGNICNYIKKHKKIYGFIFEYENNK